MSIDTLLTTQYTASNICHEIANYMSIIKFVQDDVLHDFKSRNLSEETLEQLFVNIDIAMLIMDFFRNLYSPSQSKNDVLKILHNIYKFKGVKISGLNPDSSDSIKTYSVERIAASLLFIILKLSRAKNDIIFDSLSGNIVINIKGYSPDFKKELNKILTDGDDGETTQNVFNVMIHYAKCLAAVDKYAIKIDDKNVDNLRIIICKQ